MAQIHSEHVINYLHSKQLIKMTQCVNDSESAFPRMCPPTTTSIIIKHFPLCSLRRTLQTGNTHKQSERLTKSSTHTRICHIRVPDNVVLYDTEKAVSDLSIHLVLWKKAEIWALFVWILGCSAHSRCQQHWDTHWCCMLPCWFP